MAKNTLTRKKARAVEDWLMDAKNWRDIEARRLSKEDAASLATTACGFTVTAPNIETCTGTIGKKWPSTGTAKSRAAYKVHMLKAAVKHLYESGRIAPPSEAVARVLGLPWQPAEGPESSPAAEADPTLFDQAAESAAN